MLPFENMKYQNFHLIKRLVFYWKKFLNSVQRKYNIFFPSISSVYSNLYLILHNCHSRQFQNLILQKLIETFMFSFSDFNFTYAIFLKTFIFVASIDDSSFDLEM